MDTSIKELKILGFWTSNDKNPYKIRAKIVHKSGRRKPELLLIKEFYFKNKLFSTTKLGRINQSLSNQIIKWLESYNEFLKDYE